MMTPAAPNSLTAAMASAAAAAAAGATFVNPLAANPLNHQMILQLLASKVSPDAYTRCVVVPRLPAALDAGKLTPLMAVAGAVVDLAVVGTPGDQLALVEYTDPAHVITALTLNGMKLGDTDILQVGLRRHDWWGWWGWRMRDAAGGFDY
jgi:hypothetical protein